MDKALIPVGYELSSVKSGFSALGKWLCLMILFLQWMVTCFYGIYTFGGEFLTLNGLKAYETSKILFKFVHKLWQNFDVLADIFLPKERISTEGIESINNFIH